MTWTWDILDSGDLAVWTYDQDPSSDAPAATMAPSGDGFMWTHNNKGLQNFPNELFDLMWDVAVTYYNNNGGNIDFKLVRLGFEAAFEQIERR